MKKILILGDIHGRTIWKDVIKKENPDLTIFLGDYVTTHENISSEQQIDNLKDILQYKEEHNVILLRGNHDVQMLGYSWAECSGFDYKVYEYMSSIKDEFLSKTRWIYILGDIIFSHAGISTEWLKVANIEFINKINEMEPSEIFGFWPNRPDYYGTSPTQPCTWIRPDTLCRYNVKGFDQVVGHTPVGNIVNCKEASKYKQNIWLCDCLPHQYLTIVNNEFIVNEVKI